MSEFKPTTESNWVYDDEAQLVYTGEKHDGKWVAQVRGWGWIQYMDYARDRQRSNGELIAEAGTVYHETGLTPRQLVQQRDELLEALKLCKFDSLNMTLADLAFIRNVYANATKGE